MLHLVYLSHVTFLELKIKLARATCTDRYLHRERGSEGDTWKENYSVIEVYLDVYQYKLCSIISACSHLCLKLHCGMLIRIHFTGKTGAANCGKWGKEVY